MRDAGDVAVGTVVPLQAWRLELWTRTVPVRALGGSVGHVHAHFNVTFRRSDSWMCGPLPAWVMDQG